MKSSLMSTVYAYLVLALILAAFGLAGTSDLESARLLHPVSFVVSR